MTGEGADELLGGYHWFDGDRRMQKFLGMPAFLRQTFAQLPLNVSTAARRVLRQAPQDPIARYLLWQEIADNPTLNQLLTTNHQQPATSNLIQNPKSKIQNLHPLHQFLTLDSHTRMVDFINFEVDRMSMAASIEARPPFLDHELWEWCATQSPDFKLTGEANKLLLRWGVAQEKLLPEAIIQRTKQGLATPHADWWRRERLSPWVEEALAESALKESGYFMPAFVAQLRHEHQQGKANHSRVLTGVLTTQIWHDTVLL
jgi:asparagine synthase (glutamine-hydrolysing)